MSQIGAHVGRLESIPAEQVTSHRIAAPRAVRRAAAGMLDAQAMDLLFALGRVAAGLDQPSLKDGSRQPDLIAALYRAHVALSSDIFALMAHGRGILCRDLLRFWREEDDRYFV